MSDLTTIQLERPTREQFRDEFTLPGESANDALERMMSESEPPQMGVDEAEAERIAEETFDRKIKEFR